MTIRSRNDRSRTIMRDDLFSLGKPTSSRPVFEAQAMQKVSIFDDVSDLSLAEKMVSQMSDIKVIEDFHKMTDAPPIQTMEIAVGNPSAWVLCWGEAHEFIEGRLRAKGALRSFAGFLAEPGESYRCDYVVKGKKHEDTDIPPYYVGPIALNEQGQIVQSMDIGVPFAGSQSSIKGENYLVASEKAYIIHVGVQGPLDNKDENFKPEFEKIRLTKINSLEKS